MFSFMGVWINGWVNNGEASDLRCFRTHYDVTVIWCLENAIIITFSLAIRDFTRLYVKTSVRLEERSPVWNQFHQQFISEDVHTTAKIKHSLIWSQSSWISLAINKSFTFKFDPMTGLLEMDTNLEGMSMLTWRKYRLTKSFQCPTDSTDVKNWSKCTFNGCLLIRVWHSLGNLFQRVIFRNHYITIKTLSWWGVYMLRVTFPLC